MGDAIELPDGFEIRDVRVEDAQVVADLINEVTLAEVGIPWTTADEERAGLTSPGRDDLPANALVVQQDGSPAGLLMIWAVPPLTDILALVFVRPALWGQGLSAALLRLAEERARAAADLEPPGKRIVLHVSRFADNDPARRLFESLGFGYVRRFWVMEMEIDAAPPAPAVPEGISIRAFEPGRDDAALHAALAEAFQDHWGTPFPAFQEWRHLEIEGEGVGFDPSLWYVATEGEEIVGAVCCRATSPRADGTAEVRDLAVRRAWRRRGVALALLHTAFGEFHRRKIPRAELAVDAENPTGATRLYERAGMHVALSWEVWEKELRPATGT